MKIMNRHIAFGMPRNLKTQVIISLALVLPFMILELINRRSFQEGFPVALFGMMWLLPLSFILILMSSVRSLRAGNRNPANWLVLLPKVVLLILIAWVWASLMIDQLPCFLGVPKCD